MFEEINTQLIEVKERLREKQRYESLLLKSQKKLQEEKQHFQELSKRLNKEEYDIKKLESSTLTSLFYQILGTKDQQIDKERQEFLAAKLKFDGCKNMISTLESELYSLQSHIDKLGDPQSEYQKLFKEKEKVLIDSKDEKLMELLEKIAGLNSDSKELKEAITVGNEVLLELKKVISTLKSAGNWGTFDMLGGGIIATAVKHSKIDNAKQSIHRVQYLLHRFSEELSDVQSPESDLGIEIGSFNTFADYFFDGLIFDWIVQSKIHRSLKNAENMRREISSITSNLHNELNRVVKERDELEKQQKGLVENTI